MDSCTLYPAPSHSNGPQDTHDLAAQIQEQVRRLGSLATAIDEAVDFCADTSRDSINDRLGRTLDYLHLHAEIVPKVLALAEQIEVMSRQSAGHV